MADMRPSNRPVELVPKTDANPEGKGVNGFLADWRATEPRGIVAKPQRQVLAELFTSMLVLSSAFKYRPAQGRPNYLYCIDGQWSLSLIAPEEWTSERRDGFAGTCTLQHDMTWTILPSERLATDSPVSAEIRRFFAVFAEMLNTDATLEDILPFYAPQMPYYQRLYASALSRSVSAAVVRGDQAAISSRDWRTQLADLDHELLTYSGLDQAAENRA